MTEDLDDMLRGWDYNPTDERSNVRLVVGGDGKETVQLRIRFGVLQLYADGAPESGGESELDSLRREMAAYRSEKGGMEGFSIGAMRTAQISQEIMDYYQRRVCFFILGDYRRAMRDAEHNLELLALLKAYSVDEETAFNHDRYRAFVIMDRARAAAMLSVEQDDIDRALEGINGAVVEIGEFYKEYGREDLAKESKEIEVLDDLRSNLRKDYQAPLTEVERIDELRAEQTRAIAREDYEKAARLRDEIRQLEHKPKG